MKFIFVFLAVIACAFAAAVYKHESHVRTPVGLIPRACVHSVPNGAHVQELESGETRVTHPDGTHRLIPECKEWKHISQRAHTRRNLKDLPFDYDGWLSYTAYNDSKGFDSFLGTFSVPEMPAEDPDILYIFTGLQNIDWIPKVDPEPSGPFDIIQPVLQYPGDEGNYWSVKSWYVTLKSGALASDEIKMVPGDAVFGNMTRTGAESWYIGSTVVSSGQTTKIDVTNSRLAVQPWAYNTIECYGCESCKTFPDNVCQFGKLQIFQGTTAVQPEWRVTPKPPKKTFCKETATVAGPGSVTFSFQ